MIGYLSSQRKYRGNYMQKSIADKSILEDIRREIAAGLSRDIPAAEFEKYRTAILSWYGGIARQKSTCRDFEKTLVPFSDSKKLILKRAKGESIGGRKVGKKNAIITGDPKVTPLSRFVRLLPSTIKDGGPSLNTLLSLVLTVAPHIKVILNKPIESETACAIIRHQARYEWNVDNPRDSTKYLSRDALLKQLKRWRTNISTDNVHRAIRYLEESKIIQEISINGRLYYAAHDDLRVCKATRDEE